MKNMNLGKRGSPYLFPESFMMFMMIWHQYLDYRGLEGMARSLVDPGIIPYYGDYTTVWHRIHDMRPSLDISGLQSMSIGTDGTGLKTNNAGSPRITKYGASAPFETFFVAGSMLTAIWIIYHIIISWGRVGIFVKYKVKLYKARLLLTGIIPPYNRHWSTWVCLL